MASMNTINPTNPIIPATLYTQQPQIIVQQDNSAFPTGIVLDETNFPLWSQLMEMRIEARNKVGYLIGETVKLATNDPGYATWITDNHKVKSWLIDSTSPHLMQRFIRLATANEIWEAVAKTFYDGSDETRLMMVGDGCRPLGECVRTEGGEGKEEMERFLKVMAMALGKPKWVALMVAEGEGRGMRMKAEG
ncbi:hypothetical protein RJ640_011895 [Escallonia rubra]|uniref:Retrotransposon Copia-like N-terminal domain-containing protein n=1 Tax=Escallonia rubra TaxID=112253 RepID=A0AA88RH55_9ASTE|nr:hypothetical protein RJ640_011895 [Escallonia rubra]